MTEIVERLLAYLPRRDYRTLNVLANHFVFTDRHPVFKRVWPGTERKLVDHADMDARDRVCSGGATAEDRFVECMRPDRCRA